ncbi:superoxide dismutase family protein [Erythrobacter sp. THAF29]|uniref:superoxide dismutase family protein n=1 Tax=Erythrobacter sp. THAF29 TaxID=2587851 RepID=UPI001268EA6C|nr:superoxide dismutase family protein [Erythrobacter sp. THAF29]QFT76151.1 Superoxide dismutase [Cu-Zn] precursor [Erythrobacter sp. THAF29]
MRNLSALGLASIAAAITGCTGSETAISDQESTVENAAIQLAVAELSNSQGAPAGTVTLNQNAESLTLEIALQGLEDGEHGFHLHMTGQCDAPDFTSAGGHLNPFEKSHGTLNEDGKHLGDLPNLVIDTDGTFTGSASLEGDAAELVPLIFDEDGTSVMVHAGPDDYRSDPAGNAGPRIACGVLVRS